MDSILMYKKNDDDDYYHILGCDQNSSTEQIHYEYKVKALMCHPDKCDTNNEDEQFKRLIKAKDVLCDPIKRKLYDTWRMNGISMPFEVWSNLSTDVRNSMHWINQKKSPLMIECQTNKCHINRNIESNISWERDSGNELLRKFRNYQI